MLLLDTHFLLWAAKAPERLPASARERIEEAAGGLAFSSVSIWEVAIKAARNRPDFRVDPALLKLGLLRSGYREIALTGEHALELMHLPPLHGDPFDRMLIAQARAESSVLLTADATMGRYGAPVSLMR